MVKHKLDTLGTSMQSSLDELYSAVHATKDLVALDWGLRSFRHTGPRDDF